MRIIPNKRFLYCVFRRDRTSLERNPQTINRIAGALHGMGLDKIYEKCCEPKETNRQIGPLFKRWVASGALGIMPVSLNKFTSSNDNAILDASDSEMLNWAKNTINYTRNKGLDFVARFNGEYIIGEAKFLTDFGGHQNAQLEDAISTLNTPEVNAKIIAIGFKKQKKTITAITPKTIAGILSSSFKILYILYSFILNKFQNMLFSKN